MSNGNIKRIVAPITYIVTTDASIEVDTSSGGLTTIILQQIFYTNPDKKLYINDISNNASVGNIVIQTSGSDLINNAPTLVLSDNGISAQIVISDKNRFIGNLSTDDSAPPVPIINDKNFVFQQTMNLATWTVSHNLNKRCAVQVLDTLYNEIEAKIYWVNNNEVEVYLNKAQMGWVYCN